MVDGILIKWDAVRAPSVGHRDKRRSTRTRARAA